MERIYAVQVLRFGWLRRRAKTGPIGKSVRNGLTQAADRQLRFYERGSEHISGPRILLNQ
jgi:3-methyladenine DNA glycosylase Mpg